MDIFEYGEQWDYLADYYDQYTGYIYKLQDYGKAKKEAEKAGIPFNGKLVVTDTEGRVIGTTTDTRRR